MVPPGHVCTSSISDEELPPGLIHQPTMSCELVHTVSRFLTTASSFCAFTHTVPATSTAVIASTESEGWKVTRGRSHKATRKCGYLGSHRVPWSPVGSRGLWSLGDVGTCHLNHWVLRSLGHCCHALADVVSSPRWHVGTWSHGHGIGWSVRHLVTGQREHLEHFGAWARVQLAIW